MDTPWFLVKNQSADTDEYSGVWMRKHALKFRLGLCLLGLLAPLSVLAGQVKVKAIKAGGSYFSREEGAPTLSWAQKAAADGWEHHKIGSRSEAREFELTLESGVWFFGASIPEGYRATYTAGGGEYRDVPTGGVPVTVPKSGAVELMFNYVPAKATLPEEPDVQRLICLPEPKDNSSFLSTKDIYGTSAGVRIGLSRNFGGAAVVFEIIDSVTRTKRLNVLDSELANGALQARFTAKDLQARQKYTFLQGNGNGVGRWGFQSTFKELNQTDWVPLYSDREERLQDGAITKASPCFNIGRKFLDGQVDVTLDTISTPQGAKLPRATKVYRVRSKEDLELKDWVAEQALTLSKTAAAEGNLRVYLVGHQRKWASSGLQPFRAGFVEKADARCDSVYVKDDDSLKTLRSECETGAIAYAVFVWNVGGKDFAMAVSNEAGRAFVGNLQMQKAVSCREPDAYDPWPKCGSLEWRSRLSLLTTMGEQRDSGYTEFFKKNEPTDYRMYYIVGTPQELVELGFTYEGGPRASSDIALNMQRVGSASVALDGAQVAGAKMPSELAPPVMEVAGEMADLASDESPLAKLLDENPVAVPKDLSSPLPTPTRKVAAEPVIQPATVPAGIPGRAVRPSDMKVGNLSFRMVASHSNKCVGFERGRVAQWSCQEADPKHRTKITMLTPGTSDLSSGAGVCLAVDNFFKLDGAEVQAAPCRRDREEGPTRYQAVALPDGRYYFKSVVSGKCLDVKGADKADGASLQEFECSPGKANQSFILVLY